LLERAGKRIELRTSVFDDHFHKDIPGVGQPGGPKTDKEAAAPLPDEDPDDFVDRIDRALGTDDRDDV